MPLKSRIKRIFAVTEPEAEKKTATVQASAPAPAPSLVIRQKTIPEQLWDAGYALLKEKEPKLVQSFETTKIDGSSSIETPPTIESLTIKLSEIEKLTASRSKLENIEYVLKLKSVVAAGLQASSEASLAWSVVCTILEPLLNISREAVANREGLLYIIERLEFNNKLSTIRLRPEHNSEVLEDLQSEIRLRITTLYMKILHYLVQSSIYHRQSAFKTYIKDSVKIYGWAQLLQDIKSAETNVDKDTALLQAEENTANLQTLAIISRTQEDQECLRQLRVTDPEDDKKRIQKDKGGLLKDAYVWILEDENYKSWTQHDPKRGSSLQDRVLWIHGDPGKGKTMLLCGIVDELSKTKDKDMLAFFFCQATDPRINTAESVIRGLLYMIAEKNPTSQVLPILREKFDNAGSAAFNDANTWVVVKDLFERVLNALSEQRIWLIIDALDECNQYDRLLDLMIDAPEHVSWLVSSRNWKDIEERVHLIVQDPDNLSLELNADSVTQAVDTFIDIKVHDLVRLKRLNEATTNSVREYLSANANGTFLWVALVCQNLSKSYCTRYNIQELIKKFPQGLDAIYRRILEQIEEMHEINLVKQILSVVITAFRPLSLTELAHLLPGAINDHDYLEYMIGQSGFLVSQASTVVFLHLSAKEFLLKFFEPMVDGNPPHQFIYERSMQLLSNTLKRNIYAVKEAGCHVEYVTKLYPDPLAGIAYACLYWARHLLELWPTCTDVQIKTKNERILQQFYLKKYLYWIEALIWLKSLPLGSHAMTNLKQIFRSPNTATPNYPLRKEASDLYQDALRFILSAANVSNYPLQVYASTLYFSPTSSSIRNAFELDMPTWLKSQHEAEARWPRNSIDLSSNGSSRLRLSPDGQKLVMIGYIYIQVCSAVTGVAELTFDAEAARDAAFTTDSRYIITVAENGEVKKHDGSTGRVMNEVVVPKLVQDEDRQIFVACTYQHPYFVHSLGRYLYYRDGELSLLHNNCFDDNVVNLALSLDASRLAVATDDYKVRVYDTQSGSELWRKDHRPIPRLNEGERALPIVFTPSGDSLVGAHGENIHYWNIETGDEEFRFVEPATTVAFAFFGHDLYYSCRDGTIVRKSQAEVYTYRPFVDGLLVLSFAVTPYWLVSLNLRRLSFSDPEEIAVIGPLKTLESINRWGCSISPDCKRVAFVLPSDMVRVWSAPLSWQDIRPFPESEETEMVSLRTFLSHDDRLAVSSYPNRTAVWAVGGSPTLLFLLSRRPTRGIPSVAFSADGSFASYSMDSAEVMVVKDDCSTLTLTFSAGEDNVNEVRMTNTAHSLYAIVLGGLLIEIWDLTDTGHLMHCLQLSQLLVDLNSRLVSFSDDGSHFGYVVLATRPEQSEQSEQSEQPEQPELPELRVVDTVSGQLVEITKIHKWNPWTRLTLSSWTELTWSKGANRFRDQITLLYPDDRRLEIFMDRYYIYIDEEIILCLPTEYHYDVSGRIHDNTVIHLLSEDRISVLEIDVEKALNEESTRLKKD